MSLVRIFRRFTFDARANGIGSTTSPLNFLRINTAVTAQFALQEVHPPVAARPRPSDDELRRKLEMCRDQYRLQLRRGESSEWHMITLAQIATLQMVLGEHPDPDLPFICLI
jgi:hypothetical protein